MPELEQLGSCPQCGRVHVLFRARATIVVVREHPRAPKDVVMAVTESALEAKLHIQRDAFMSPVVPIIDISITPTSAGGP